MAHFEKKDFPEIFYCITDDYRREVQLTPEQAYDLLQWLYERRDEMFQALPPEAKQEKPEAVKAWQQAKSQVEAWQRDHPFVPDSDDKPAVRMLEMRLYEADWWRYNELKRLMPTIYMESEGPAAETGAPVRVYSVRADTLSQDAIRLLNETPLDWKFTDVLVPVAEEDES